MDIEYGPYVEEEYEPTTLFLPSDQELPSPEEHSEIIERIKENQE